MEAANMLIAIAEQGTSIEDRVLACVQKIIKDLRKQNPDVDFSDNTYRELFIMCQAFARQLEDTIASESATDNSTLFGTAINYNYFNQQRQF